MDHHQLLQQGVQKGFIRFNDDKSRVTYLKLNKTRSYKTEEIVQVNVYLVLILNYLYPAEHIKILVPVQMGSETREADIVVYDDDTGEKPLIVVECKRQEVSEAEYAQSVNQGFSYAVSLGADYVWATSGIKNEYYRISEDRPQHKQLVSDIPKYGVSEVRHYKYAKGGGRDYFDLEKVSESALTARFKQAHNALWGGGELNPSEAFDELDKLIFCKLRDEEEAKDRAAGEAYHFQIILEKDAKDNDVSARALAERVRELYKKGKAKDAEVFKDNIRLPDSKIKTVVSYLQDISLSKTDLDSKGRAFETFMGSFFRGDFGQFFTPRPIVKFIVDVLPITRHSRVLDTSCGSGGFLLHALDKVRRHAEAAHPAEEVAEEIVNRYRHWHGFAQYNLFGIEINEQISRTAKMNMIIHDDGHTNVITADGLAPYAEIDERTGNSGFKNDSFDFIITNPPFGSKIRLAEQGYMRNYRMAKKETDWLSIGGNESWRKSQSTEVLFIERCHQYLKASGYLAIVLPDGVLTNASLQYVRDNIEEMYRLVAVVSMPQTAFSATGAGVKSSVLFVRKHAAAQTDKIIGRKRSLQDHIKTEYDYINRIYEIRKAKKQAVKNLTGAARQRVSAEYKKQEDDLKAMLAAQYNERWKKTQDEYPVFMAIAEDIGYDATGRETGTNELEFIGEELARFIKWIDENE